MYSATAEAAVASILVSNSGNDLGTTSGVDGLCGTSTAAALVGWAWVFLVGKIGAGVDGFVSWGAAIVDNFGGVGAGTGTDSNFDFIVEVIGGMESASVIIKK